jgi:hypothetical protein
VTIQEFLVFAGRYPWALLGVFVSVPVATWVVGRLHRCGQGGTTPWKYLYATLVYISCVPGLFAAVVTAYSLFFTSANLLEVNALVYLLPIVSMVVTLVLLGQNVDFAEVPGFHRLSGLMTLIGVSFAVALAISKTRVWLFFGGSIFLLFAIAAVAFVFMKWGIRAGFRRSSEQKERRPDFMDELGRHR